MWQRLYRLCTPDPQVTEHVVQGPHDVQPVNCGKVVVVVSVVVVEGVVVVVVRVVVVFVVVGVVVGIVVIIVVVVDGVVGALEVVVDEGEAVDLVALVGVLVIVVGEVVGVLVICVSIGVVCILVNDVIVDLSDLVSAVKVTVDVVGELLFAGEILVVDMKAKSVSSLLCPAAKALAGPSCLSLESLSWNTEK